eukprot:PLAT7008.17.p1 GENE.PLAT7008.17~~PLAT7008.17.p1  ORF type:complete len:917 (-),score=478.69 PLAT7008.17:70-2820(-)
MSEWRGSGGRKGGGRRRRGRGGRGGRGGDRRGGGGKPGGRWAALEEDRRAVRADRRRPRRRADGLAPEPYLAAELAPAEAAGFKAAGVLPWRMAGGQLQVLVGHEWRRKGRSKAPAKLEACVLGGKREPGESAVETGVREMWEESGQLLSSAALAAVKAGVAGLMWYPDAKYVLLLVGVTEDMAALHTLPEAYAALEKRPALAEMETLHWADWATLGGRDVRFASFAWTMLRTPVLAAAMTAAAAGDALPLTSAPALAAAAAERAHPGVEEGKGAELPAEEEDAAVPDGPVIGVDVIDIGFNATNRSFKRDLPAVVARAVAARVVTTIATGTSARASEDAAAMALRFPVGRMFSTAGVHPHDAKTWRDGSDGTEQLLRRLAGEAQVVAIGECGLDFNRDASPRDVQIDVFRKQVALACELRMPLFCHEREAHEAFMAVVGEFGDRLPPLIVHCFTGTAEEADAYMRAGFFLGFTGIICKKSRGEPLRAIIPALPLERLMVETDAPYMFPGSGGRRPRCEPHHTRNVIARLADLLGRPRDEVAAATAQTARSFFRLDDAAAALEAAGHAPPAAKRAEDAARRAEQMALSDSARFVDTHVHLDIIMNRLRVATYDVMARKARFPRQLGGCVSVFCDPVAFAPSVAIYDAVLEFDGVYATFGCHPHAAKSYNEALEARIVAAQAHPRAVAWGECGLDYNRNHSKPAVQRRVFLRQMELAVALGKPLVVHSRDADEDMLRMLKESMPADWRIHLHCCTCSAETVTALLEAFPNLYVGFTGMITYPKMDWLRAIVASTPLERILLETDGPYLMPKESEEDAAAAAGGKKRKKKKKNKGVCSPAHLPLIAEEVATVKGIPLERVVRQTTLNAGVMYGVEEWVLSGSSAAAADEVAAELAVESVDGDAAVAALADAIAAVDLE